MQHTLSAPPLLVVPVHHHAFVVRRHGVICVVLLHDVAGRFQFPFQLRILGRQDVVVDQFRHKDVFRFLNVCDPWLPEKAQNVYRVHGDVADSVQLGAVPAHVPDKRPLLQLRPLTVRVDFLEIVLFEDHRQDGREPLCFFPVVRLPWPDGGRWVCRNRVRVLSHDDVKEPCARPLIVHRIPFLNLPPALEPPPVFARRHARFEVCLARLVFLQRGKRLPHLRFTDWLRQHRRALFHRLIFHLSLPPSPARLPL